MKKCLPKSWETKTSIYRTAMSLLERMDVEKITVRAIAKEAGISVGTFYIYYETKMDVFEDAYDLMDQYFETVVKKNMPEGSTREKLEYYFDQYRYYNLERTPIKLINLLTKYTSGKKLTNYGYGIQHVLKQIIEEGKSSGEIVSEESAEEIVLFLLTCMRGCFRHWVITGNVVDINTMSKSYASKVIGVYVKD